uniref:Uncharacterized protein n=1 Tax=Chromera velia CCMP2878 TaxID=1169474 RepID=A0A0G4IAX2_9ALVE|eukprot:Cvel_12699.t1-p1 / transcript=Cvel_12699.t1 / gene=Cvel_12699 / organism=Chromera_velia_CCMP2878 / gene_product=hypothetical protein / transcript_product=hypothetical protein / location=Cvel_scaffold841:32297-54459(+) / protein_length=931 / sequence_SO=supercontig / SO=protein_coding / is_pseudo=false
MSNYEDDPDPNPSETTLMLGGSEEEKVCKEENQNDQEVTSPRALVTLPVDGCTVSPSLAEEVLNREDSGAPPYVVAGQGEGGETGEEGVEVLTEEEKRRMMTDSLQRCLRAGDKKENIGTLAVDMLAHVIAFEQDHEFAQDCIPWIALRHVQYDVPLDKMPVLRSPSSSRRVGKSPKGKLGGGSSTKGQGALAEDLCALLTWLVEAVQDIKKLRGVVDCLGIPFDALFKNCGQVPDLLKEVVGQDWDPEHDEAWQWLWSLVVDERNNNDRERVFAGWQSVEAAVLRERTANRQGEANPAEFFLSEEEKNRKAMEKRSSVTPGGDVTGEGPEGGEGDEESGGGEGAFEAEGKRGLANWLCGRRKKKKAHMGGEGSLIDNNEKEERQKALKHKLQTAYKPPKEVTAAVLDEFWQQVSEAPTIGQSLKKLAQEEWLPQYQHAWTKFFNIAAAGLAEFIVAGLDPVTRALVTGSLADLQNALMGKARGLRTKCCCESNKSGVYCGRELFWSVYGREILSVLCNEAPDLLKVFLDGHIWTSDLELTSERGALYKSTAQFPLSRVALLGRGRFAAHPTIEWIVEAKWRLFARTEFLIRNFFYLFIALFGTLGYVWLQAGDPWTSFSFRCLALLCAVTLSFLEILTCIRQTQNGFVVGGLPFHMTLAYITLAFATAFRLIAGQSLPATGGTENAVLITIGLLVGSFRPDFENEADLLITRFFVLSYMSIASLLLAKFLLVLYADTVMVRRSAIGGEESDSEEAALGRAVMVADIENSLTPSRLKRLHERHVKDLFEQNLFFNSELEHSPQGGVAVEMQPSFRSPSLDTDGQNDRRQIYDSEEGPEMPWPVETVNEKEAAGDSDNADSEAQREMKAVCDSISSVEKAMKGLSTLMAKIGRTLKSAGLVDHNDGTTARESGTFGTTAMLTASSGGNSNKR